MTKVKDKMEIFEEVMDKVRYGNTSISEEELHEVYDVGYSDGYSSGLESQSKVVESYFYKLLLDEVLDLNQRWYNDYTKQIFPKTLPSSVMVEISKLWESEIKPDLFGGKVDGGRLVHLIEDMVYMLKDQYELRTDEYVDGFIWDRDTNPDGVKKHLTKDEVKEMVEGGQK